MYENLIALSSFCQPLGGNHFEIGSGIDANLDVETAILPLNTRVSNG